MATYNKTHDGWQYFNGINKDRILSPEDAQIINKFIKKLTIELTDTE